MKYNSEINLKLGSSSALMSVTDLVEEYVGFNKGDVTDLTTLAG